MQNEKDPGIQRFWIQILKLLRMGFLPLLLIHILLLILILILKKLAQMAQKSRILTNCTTA